ncbi:hypothetical protein [Paraliomyxa miuraensis]|uniref:hypothetical protein n=1 Tax=Paraliomyxa miuraensis TaxID=376150 RepID=UPI00225AF4F5|nr:hypothetical protein [Paraliomyxa miuraensis]MCX4248041.1 hypothetical protein [Paraliomyxa miuraensis]
MSLIHDSHDPLPSTLRSRGLLAVIGVSVLALGACDPGTDDFDDPERMAELEDAELDVDEEAALVDPASALEPLADDEPVPDLDPDLDLVAVPDVQAYSWQNWISEETPPSTCPTGQIVTGFDCRNGWCDDVRIECHSFGGTLGGSWWSGWISEETPNNFHQCPGTQYITGVACSGGWCDNLSFQCTDTSYGKSGCYWTPPYSEEQPPFYAPGGKAIAGVWCQGSRCDNKRYWVCTL